MDTLKIDVMVADISWGLRWHYFGDNQKRSKKVRGTGIAERTHEYVATKMKEGKAIASSLRRCICRIYLHWIMGKQACIATSGIDHALTEIRMAKHYQTSLFQLARLRWPQAKIFSLTSGAAWWKWIRNWDMYRSLLTSWPTTKPFGKDVKGA